MRKFTGSFLIILFLSVSIAGETALSQVLNVERFRGAAVETGWAGELKFDVSLSKYRDNIIRLGNEANAAYYSPRHSYLLLNSIDLVNVDGADLVSKGFVHLRSTLFRQDAWSPELFVQYQYNQNLGMQRRALAGALIKHRFLDRENVRGHISTGGMFEYERWAVDNGEDIENHFFKNSTNIVLRGDVNRQTGITLIGYYQARPTEFLEPRIISENRLSIRMTERITFMVNFTLSYDFNPVIDIPSLTYELKNGVVVSI